MKHLSVDVTLLTLLVLLLLGIGLTPHVSYAQTFRDALGPNPVIGSVTSVARGACPEGQNVSQVVFGVGIFESRSHVGCTAQVLGLVTLSTLKVTVVGPSLTYPRDGSIPYPSTMRNENPNSVDTSHYGIVVEVQTITSSDTAQTFTMPGAILIAPGATLVSVNTMIHSKLKLSGLVPGFRFRTLCVSDTILQPIVSFALGTQKFTTAASSESLNGAACLGTAKLRSFFPNLVSITSTITQTLQMTSTSSSPLLLVADIVVADQIVTEAQANGGSTVVRPQGWGSATKPLRHALQCPSGRHVVFNYRFKLRVLDVVSKSDRYFWFQLDGLQTAMDETYVAFPALRGCPPGSISECGLYADTFLPQDITMSSDAALMTVMYNAGGPSDILEFEYRFSCKVSQCPATSLTFAPTNEKVSLSQSSSSLFTRASFCGSYCEYRIDCLQNGFIVVSKNRCDDVFSGLSENVFVQNGVDRSALCTQDTMYPLKSSTRQLFWFQHQFVVTWCSLWSTKELTEVCADVPKYITSFTTISPSAEVRPLDHHRGETILNAECFPTKCSVRTPQSVTHNASVSTVSFYGVVAVGSECAWVIHCSPSQTSMEVTVTLQMIGNGSPASVQFDDNKTTTYSSDVSQKTLFDLKYRQSFLNVRVVNPFDLRSTAFSLSLSYVCVDRNVADPLTAGTPSNEGMSGLLLIILAALIGIALLAALLYFMCKYKSKMTCFEPSKKPPPPPPPPPPPAPSRPVGLGATWLDHADEVVEDLNKRKYDRLTAPADFELPVLPQTPQPPPKPDFAKPIDMTDTRGHPPISTGTFLRRHPPGGVGVGDRKKDVELL